MGAERVMLGSDYPFPLGEHRVGSLIRASQLSPRQKIACWAEMRAKFLGLQDRAAKLQSKMRNQDGTPIVAAG